MPTIMPLIGLCSDCRVQFTQAGQKVNSTITKTFGRIGDFFRAQSRKGYEEALARIVTAVDSGKLKSTDKAPAATRFIDVGVFGPLDGVDWAELHALAEENKMRLATVSDLMALLRFAIGTK